MLDSTTSYQPSDLNLQRRVHLSLMVYLRVKVDLLRMTRVFVSSIPQNIRSDLVISV